MSAPHLGPGHVVAGKYTIRSLLAFGGAAATYHGTDAQGGQVALKLLDPAIGQRADVMGELDRVTGEVAALVGYGIHPVIDSGYDQSTSAPFRASQYLTVPSLTRLLETGPLSEQVVGAILGGLATALDAAHARGLHHHALKPTDVFVGPAPQYPVLVCDFGARVIRDAMPTQETYGQSAPWWAPEQHQPGAQLGPQTDVYSVALLAFYALTGRPYWRCCQTSPLDLQVLQQEAFGVHVPASVRAQELGRSLNSALDGWFAAALAMDPSARPRSAGELMQAFSALVVDPAAASAAAAPQAQVSYSEGQYAYAASEPSSPAAAAPMAPAVAPSAAGHVAPAPASEPLHPATPGLPAFPEPAAKRKSSGMAPVIVGVIGAILLGGAAVAYLFLRTPAMDAGPVATATASTDDVASDTSATTETDGDADAGVADAASDGGADVSKTVDVTFVCVPECDQVVVDGEKVDKPAEPVPLLPGKHTVVVSKGGYIPRKETISVELGGPVEKKIVLVKLGTGPKKKPCGKFLKRCD